MLADKSDMLVYKQVVTTAKAILFLYKTLVVAIVLHSLSLQCLSSLLYNC